MKSLKLSAAMSVLLGVMSSVPAASAQSTPPPTNSAPVSRTSATGASKGDAFTRSPETAEAVTLTEEKPEAKKEAAPKAEKPAKKERAPSVVARIKSLLAADPTLPVKAIEDQLRLEGFTTFAASTPSVIRQDFLASWRLLQQHGRASGLDL